MADNTLYYGDNLEVLRHYPPSAQVNRTFKKAVRRKPKKHAGQHGLGLDD